MKRILPALPTVVTILLAALMLAHGPIAQLPHYHDFADQRTLFGLPHALDVFSNLGFSLLGIWALGRLRPYAANPALRAGWPGYQLMLVAMVLVGLGSSYYHLVPDNAHLLWDRLPIAMLCAGLLTAVRAETRPGVHTTATMLTLLLCAVAAVGWWQWTDAQGNGDLRPYLLLQSLPLLLIPLWQAAYGAARADRLAFGMAMLVYVLAKLAELNDHAIFAATGLISGHSLKHLLATLALGLIVARLVARTGGSHGFTYGGTRPYTAG